MEQVFRIEIPVEVINKTDMSSFQKLESALNKIYSQFREGKTAAGEMFDAVSSGSSKAKSSISDIENAAFGVSSALEDVGSAAEDSGNQQSEAFENAEESAKNNEDAVDGVAEAYREVSSAADEAGSSTSDVFSGATASADKFTQRMEKSEQSLKKMFKDKLELIMSAIDRASPILNTIKSNLKGLVGKAWHIAIRMKDFVTAPFRKLFQMISSPIAIGLSVAGIGFGASDFYQTFGGFETGMSGVKALTEATESEFVRLKETAKQLGASTIFSAPEVAEGMQNLGAAGFTANEIIDAMPGLLNLAASGGESLANSSEIAATTLRGFGLEASKASLVADVLAKVASETNASISSTGEAMKYISPVAKSMGLSLFEISTAIGILADVGIKGSMAGTSLKTALTRLAAPSSEAAKVMSSLGLEFYDTEGKMKSLSSIINSLNEKTSSLTEQEKQNAIVTMFGREALSSVLALMEAGGDTIETTSKRYEECAGAAEKMANVRLDNLPGDIEELGGAIETAKIDLMTMLNPYLREGVQWLTGKIPELQNGIENFVTKSITKAKELKSSISSVFEMNEFKNADGFADKFFVAWDNIVAEPFEKWWGRGGKEKILGKISDIGVGAGEMLNGIFTGIVAGITGQELDVSGLNVSGFAKAGAEGAKTFVSSFLSGLNIPDLFGKLPSLAKFGLFNFGALKVGGGIRSTIKMFSELKGAIIGVGGAAGSAAPALGGVGTAAASGFAKLGSVLGVVKTGLSAIPGWGWAAAAAITAAAVGVKLYNDHLTDQQAKMDNATHAAQDSIRTYQESARTYVEMSDKIDRIHEIEIKISGASGNEASIATAQEMLDMLDRTHNVDITFFEASGNEAAVLAAKERLTTIEDKRAEITLTLTENNISPDKIKQYTDEMVLIKEKQATILIALDGASADVKTIAAYKEELKGIESRTAELKAKIADDSTPKEDIAGYIEEYQKLQDRAAFIKLFLSGAGLKQSELGDLVEQWQTLESREAEITADLSAAGMQESDIQRVKDLWAGIADQTASLKLMMDENGMQIGDLETLRGELQDLYASVVGLSGGIITQEDVESGRVSQENLDALLEQQLMMAQTNLNKQIAAANQEMAFIPDHIAARDAARAQIDTSYSNIKAKNDDAVFLSGLEKLRENALSEYEKAVSVPGISKKEIAAQKEKLLDAGTAIRDSYIDYFGNDGGPVSAFALDPRWLMGTNYPIVGFAPGDRGILRDALASVGEGKSLWESQESYYQSEYDSHDLALVNAYQSQKAIIESASFMGSDQMGMTLEQVAVNYGKLDEAGRKMFQDAVSALNALNAQTDYIADDQKVQATSLVDLAAKSEYMANIRTQLETISTQYQTMSADEAQAFNTDNLEAINAALEGLGLEQISSLDQLNSALAQLEGVDLSSFTLEAVQSAFAAVGGDASTAESQVAALKAAIDSVAGSNTSSSHTHTNTIINRTIEVSGGRVAFNANGGIYDGAFLSWVAEDGPEAIIPLGSSRRERGIDLWLQAGKMLGVGEFADGGIMAPYSGSIEQATGVGIYDGAAPEDDDESPRRRAWSMSADGFTTGGGGFSGNVNVSVSANPTFQIDGSTSPDEVIAIIKQKQKELAEIFGEAIADQLEDIVSNMV